MPRAHPQDNASHPPLPRFPSLLLIAVHIAALWAVAVTQPLLHLLAQSPEFLTAHQAERLDVVLLVAALTLAGPAALTLAAWSAAMAGRRAQAVTLGLIIGALSVLIAVQICKAAGVDSAAVAIPLAVIAAIAAAIVYLRSAHARTFVSWLGAAIAIVPLVFLSQPPIRRLVAPPQQQARGGAQVTGTLAPVVMVVLDEVPLVSLLDRGGWLDERHYPNFVQLARDGIWFRNATTVSDYTRWSLPAIVSGRYPRPDASPSAGDHRETLFTLLAGTHRLEAVEAVTQLCPVLLCGRPERPVLDRMRMIADDLSIVYLHVVLPGALRADLPPLTDDWARFGAAGEARRQTVSDQRRQRQATRRRAEDETLRVMDRVAAFQQFTARISPEDEQPTFYFLHSMVSHTPHLLLPSGQLNSTRSEAAPLGLPRALPGKYKEAWPDDEWAVAQSYQRHLLQLGFTDRMLGRLIASLKAADLYDRATIVVLADHGAAFRPGLPRRDFTERAAADVLRIPLIIKFAPHLQTSSIPTTVDNGIRASDLNVETVDVAPTVAAAAGVELPWRADGGSILDPGWARAKKVIYYDSARRTQSLDAAGPDTSAALAWKQSLFGADDPFRVPRADRYAELVSKPVSELPVDNSGGEVRVDYVDDVRNMDPSETSVAFDIAGDFRPARTRGATYVAVAINDVIRAVTRTWRSAPGQWLATASLSAWRPGRNTLDVFVIAEGPGGPRLRRSIVRPGLTDAPHDAQQSRR